MKLYGIKQTSSLGIACSYQACFSLVVPIVAVLLPDVVSVIIVNKLGGLVVVLPVGVLLIISFFYFRKL